MKPLRWQSDTESASYMRMRKQQNLERSANNRTENSVFEKLMRTRWKWSRQATWGYRVFDFWCSELGVAIEIDGPEHDADYDGYRDEYNFRRSAVVVFRVPNGDDNATETVIASLNFLENWEERRKKMNVGKGNTKKERMALANMPYDRSHLEDFLTELFANIEATS